MMWSIRRRLLAWLVSGVLLSGIIATLVIYVRARDEVDELFDGQLKQIALSLREQEDLSVTQPEPPDDQEERGSWSAHGIARAYLYSASRGTGKHPALEARAMPQ